MNVDYWRLKARLLYLFNDVEFSPDTTELATATYFGDVRVIDSATHDEKWQSPQETKHEGPIHELCYTADGRYLLSISFDHTLKVWNASDGKLLHTEPLEPLATSIAVSPTRLVALGLDPGRYYTPFPNGQASEIQLGMLRMEEAGEGDRPVFEKVRRLSGLTGKVWSVAYSPDGHWLAAGCEDDVLRVWDTETWELVASLAGHQGPIVYVSFSLDGKHICASGGHFRRAMAVRTRRCLGMAVNKPSFHGVS